MLDIIFLIIISPIIFYYFYFIVRIYIGLNKLEIWQSNRVLEEFISIIIPFRNESENILQILESIENQNYPVEKYEVIFVNDSSTDDSLNKLNNNIKSKNIRVISVPENFAKQAHKKRAIRFGIENSKGEIIVTTDADCILKPNWLKTLLNGFDEKTALISGPVEFIEGKGLFYKLQKLEFTSLIITGAGLIGINKPMICNGANLTYRKNAFYEVGGFDGQLSLSSGDDEILMQRIWKKRKYKIKFCASKEAMSLTKANKNIKEFYNQRKRWASKGLFYELKSTILSIASIFLFYLSLVLLLGLSFFKLDFYLPLFAAVFTVKIFLEYLVMHKGCSILFNKNILKYFFIAEILHIPYIIISGISGIFGNFSWKDRTLSR